MWVNLMYINVWYNRVEPGIKLVGRQMQRGQKQMKKKTTDIMNIRQW